MRKSRRDRRHRPRVDSRKQRHCRYEVRLSLDDTGLPVRVGMTANADLITSAQNVLLVPKDTITADRETGHYYVNRSRPTPR